MIYIVAGVIVFLSGFIVHQSFKHMSLATMHDNAAKRIFEACNKEREEWNIERQQLLDRIQAPTFSEYKHQEAKIIKAKSGVQDIVVEQL